jgi:hypothetical protein
MKVKPENTLTAQIEKRMQAYSGNVVLFRDLASLSGKTQLSRALRKLVEKGKLIKLGYGIFAKAMYSERLKKPVMKTNLKTVLLEALTRLNIQWELGKLDEDYLSGRSTQVPAFTSVKLKSRLRRDIAYGNLRLIYE